MWWAIPILPLLIPLRGGQTHAVYAVVQHAVGAISKHSVIASASATPKAPPAAPATPASTPLVFMPQALTGLYISLSNPGWVKDGAG